MPCADRNGTRGQPSIARRRARRERAQLHPIKVAKRSLRKGDSRAAELVVGAGGSITRLIDRARDVEGEIRNGLCRWPHLPIEPKIYKERSRPMLLRSHIGGANLCKLHRPNGGLGIRAGRGGIGGAIKRRRRHRPKALGYGDEPVIDDDHPRAVACKQSPDEPLLAAPVDIVVNGRLCK